MPFAVLGSIWEVKTELLGPSHYWAHIEVSTHMPQVPATHLAHITCLLVVFAARFAFATCLVILTAYLIVLPDRSL